MFSLKKLSTFILSASLLFSFAACTDDDSPVEPGNPEGEGAPYALALAIMGSDGNFTYYVVDTEDLMSGTISAVGRGLEQSGYRDFAQGNNTIFSIGGLGVVDVNAITKDENGELVEKGDFVFDNVLNDFIQLDENTMLGAEMPVSPTNGDVATFYTVNIENVAITRTAEVPMENLSRLEWPTYTGMRVRGNQVFLSYYLMDPATYATQYTDTAYVGVFSYPEFELQHVLKDTRTGPIGAFGTRSGIIQTEGGDLYTISSSNIANGYSKQTKPGGILKIAQGENSFDEDYFFEVEGIAHIKYIGKGLAFATINTLPAAEQSAWSDKPLKAAIIDLNNQTVTDVEGTPAGFAGGGGRSFPALVEGGNVYLPIESNDGIFIYQIDPQTATATRGAKVEASFVGGLFSFR